MRIYKACTKTLNELSTEGVEHLTPQATDNYRIQLAALYGLMIEELMEIEKSRGEAWAKLQLEENGVKREKPLSIQMTDHMYDATKDGQRRIELKYRIKAVEKMVSALAGHLRRLTEEAKNSF